MVLGRMIEMVLSSRGIHESQEDIVGRTFGSLQDAPGDPLSIMQNLDGWQVQRGGQSVQLHATLRLGIPPLEILAESLEKQTPVLIALSPEHGDVGHAVVVTAVIYQDTPTGPQIDSIVVRDPWPGFRATEGKRRLTPAEISRIGYFLCVSESTTPNSPGKNLPH